LPRSTFCQRKNEPEYRWVSQRRFAQIGERVVTFSFEVQIVRGSQQEDFRDRRSRGWSGLRVNAAR